MIKPAPAKARGAAGMLFVWFLAFATAGVLIDVLVIADAGAGVIAGPGGRAMLGLAVAVGAAAIAFLLRLTLGRPTKDQGGPGAADHA